MKYFLWFNLDKVKNDKDYFLLSYLSVIMAQLASWFPKKGYLDFEDYIYGVVWGIFFIYLSFSRKNFKFKDAFRQR